ncbi:type III secretion system outer membrane ring subunit SctC [Parendozoicomonas haliclonae]|uniref:type III secretion system outer membrane ring subunit SctC n=1 Tax=Parendozoicomonas haliclonae TaxID=1960125 RepID=UPI0013FD456E|nr:type III secretion system outer membrane ring subunit SctC [Parendozoicomonas haliclonae]
MLIPLSSGANSTVIYSPWSETADYPSEPDSQKHIVQQGETLSQIAEMYGIPSALLAHHNGIPDPESITEGQIIYLPDGNYPEELLLPDAPTAAGPSTNNAPDTALSGGQTTAAQTQSPAGQDFGAKPYAYFGNSEPAADVLKNFAANYSIPVIISPNLDGVVNGKIGPLPPVEFLDKLAQLHALIWYFDGNTLYVYNSNEIEKQIINLQFMGTEQFRKTLMEIGIWDSRFYWRARPEEGIIYLSGPPRYMELVSETARLLDSKSGERQKSQLTVKVFPLRYAWADDRQFNFRNQDVTIPGVATTLRQIVQGGGIQAQSTATADSMRSVPGMQPATPAGQQPGQQNQAPQRNIQADSVFINADRRLNAVIIHDLESKMPMYESLINTLDKPLAQVEINVSIIDINTNSLEQLGVNWRLGKEDGDFIRFNPFKNSDDSVPANTFSTIINITSGKLLARVNLLSDSGNAKILARPSVLTLDNMEAVLDNSQTFYVRVAGQDSAELFPVTYGSVLKVTPRIVDEVTGRKLHLSVNIQDGGQASGTGVDDIPVVKNSSISTQAVIDENESLLVGGYYYEESTKGQTKVPVLGDMPIVGAAFRNNTDEQKKNVRLFLITPRIVNLM